MSVRGVYGAALLNGAAAACAGYCFDVVVGVYVAVVATVLLAGAAYGVGEA